MGLGREGLSLEQVIATLQPVDKQGLTIAIQDVVAQRSSYAHQHRVRRADGEYCWIEV